MLVLKKVICRIAAVSHQTILKDISHCCVLLSTSLQSEVSQHLGDTSRGAVFIIVIDEASCMSLNVVFCLWLLLGWFFWGGCVCMCVCVHALINVILLVGVLDHSNVFQAKLTNEMSAVLLQLGG